MNIALLASVCRMYALTPWSCVTINYNIGMPLVHLFDACSAMTTSRALGTFRLADATFRPARFRRWALRHSDRRDDERATLS